MSRWLCDRDYLAPDTGQYNASAISRNRRRSLPTRIHAVLGAVIRVAENFLDRGTNRAREFHRYRHIRQIDPRLDCGERLS